MSGHRTLPMRGLFVDAFWGYVACGEYRMQRCDDCGFVRYPPAPGCPECLSESAHWDALSGKGTIVSWTRFHRQYFDDLPIVMTRPFNYTGRGQGDNFLIPKIVKHFRERAPRLELGNRDVVRDFSDVRDVAGYIVRLLQSDARGLPVNLCSGTGHSLQWIIDQCRAITGHDLEVATNPAFVRANEIRSLIGSTARLGSLVGPLGPTPLGDTLRWMLEG